MKTWKTRAGARERAQCSNEVLAAWALLALAAAAVLVTYGRLPPAELYHTSVGGLRGGLGRTLVFVNFPVALVAVAIASLCARGLARWIAVALCLVVVVPGVVDQADLDAKLLNAVPAAGVALAVALTLLARREGRPPRVPRLPGDRARIVLAALLVVLAVPWWFAETGFYAPDPLLADEVPKGETIAAVHLGHHHGTDGVLLALAGLLLSRRLPSVSRPRALSAYLALMLSYGLVNAAQDAWLEQVVKRGWTTWEIPDALRPAFTPIWLVIITAAVAVELFYRSERRSSSHSDIGT